MGLVQSTKCENLFKSLKNRYFYSGVNDKYKLKYSIKIKVQVSNIIFDDLDDAYDYWRNLFKSTANEHAPMRKKCLKNGKRLLETRGNYAIQFAKDRTPENFELKKKYRNIATRERRKAVTEYLYKKSEEMKSKPRDSFSIHFDLS